MIVKIGTLNSRGGNLKKDHIIRFFNANKMDILMIQESHDIKSEFKIEIESETKCKIFASPGSAGGRGVMTMIKESEILKDCSLVAKDTEGNLVEVKAKINGESRSFMNVYTPNSVTARKKLFEKIGDMIGNETDKIIAGDLNQVCDIHLDSAGKSQKSFDRSRPARMALEKMKKDSGYCDSYRCLNPKGRGYTFTGISNYRARLDMILAHECDIGKVTKCGITPCAFSDHDLFWIEYSTDGERIKWGNGAWKFNKEILENKEHLGEIEELWTEHREEKCNFNNQLIWWDAGKAKIKSKCQELGRKMKSDRNAMETELNEKLELEMKTTGATSAGKIKELKRQLNDLIENEMKGAAIRSRADWNHLGERPTRYFFTIEKRKGDEKQMTELEDSDGHTITGKVEILEHVKKYYETHFERAEIDSEKQDVLINSISRSLTEDQSESIQGMFTKSELQKALAGTKLNRAPGLDGLTVEFYRKTFHFIAEDLLETINEIFISAKMPRSMTQGMVKLIYKNKGDRTNLKNWRAITLLNNDYKLMTAMLTNRINPLMSAIIEKDQTCSVPGNFIEDALIQIQDIQDYVNQFGGKTMICALDWTSAFDFLDHGYIKRVMTKMNLGSRIVRMIGTLHDNMYSCISINGARTQMFRLGRSCRQGDPNAAQQFTIAIEPFATLIRQDKQLHPLSLPNQPPKSLCQYADDTSVISTNARDYARVTTLTEIFEKGAGAKINSSKTEILLLGKWQPEERALLPAANIKENSKLLGVWFGPNAKKLNQQDITAKIDNAIEEWKKHHLSFQGKLLIIETKILSTLYHVIRVTGMNRLLHNAVQKRLNDFIWHPRQMKLIAYDTLQNDPEAGGLKMPNLKNINSAILTERISKCLKNDRPWKGHLIYRLGFLLRNVIPEAGSSKYAHTFKQTTVTEEIGATFRSLENQVSDWSSENFRSLKLRLHGNNDIRERVARNYDDTWRQIHDLKKDRKRRDLCYLIAHFSLPVKDMLAHRGLKLNDIKCSLCGEADETLKHLFIECRLVKNLKDLLQNRIQVRTLSQEEILFHEGRVKWRKKANESIGAYKQAIWFTRAKLYYGNIASETETKDTMRAIFLDKVR